MLITKVRVLGIALFVVISQAGLAQQNIVVLQDVSLIDGTGKAAMDHVSVMIHDGKIQRILGGHNSELPQGARVLNLPGKTVMPSIINAHGHLGLTQGTSVSPDNYTEAKIERQLKQYQRYGVTTVMSLGMNKDLLYRLRKRQGQGKLEGAAILTADRGMGIPGGVPPVKVGADQVYRPATPAEARQDVRDMAARHPNLIKIWVDTSMGKLPAADPAIYGAAIEEAHKLNLAVAAHVFYLADAKQLLADRVDILAHSIRDQAIDAETVQAIKQQGVYYIPTLQLEERSSCTPSIRHGWTQPSSGAGSIPHCGKS